MASKQVIMTFVGVQPTPFLARFSKSETGKALPRTLPATSEVAAKIRGFLIILIVSKIQPHGFPFLDAVFCLIPVIVRDAGQ